ncbi:hypothetical protein ACFLZ0_03200, partial [Patescibacteria group bacterium]
MKKLALMIKMIIRNIDKKWWKMLIFSALPFLIVLSPILFFGKVFLNSDLITSVYPNYYFYQNSLANGMSIFWNSSNFSGFPIFIGSMGFLSPIFYIFFRLLPFFVAYNLFIFICLTFTLFFTWKLLIEFGLSVFASFAGGLVYVFSQWQYISSIPIVSSLLILPLLFLIIWRLKEEGGSSSIFFGSLLIGAGWLTMHFNWLVMILSVGFLFSLFLGWSNSKKWIVFFKFLLSCIFGTIIGLFIIVPLLKYSDLSVRSMGLSYKESIEGMLGLGDFMRYFLPYFKFSIFNIAVSPTQLYLGSLPLFFLISSFRLKSSLVRFFIFLFSLCLLISIGYSPFFWVMRQFPIFNSFRGPHRWMFIGSFAAAILTSFGINYFFDFSGDKYKKILLRVLKWIGWF